MSELFIIAGPQAAGKSTTINNLSQIFRSAAALFGGKRGIPALMPLQESRQIIVHKYMLLGAPFMTDADEQEVIRCDFGRMELILERNHQPIIYLDECNIFTLAHAEIHGVERGTYWEEYCAYLTKLRARVIFIDIPPLTSWERRKERYEQRLVYFPEDEHGSVMKGYSDYLGNVYPRLVGIYDDLPFPKVKIDGRISEKAVCDTVTKVIKELSETI